MALVVPEELRLESLRRWGASEPLLLQSSGVLLHEAFRFECLGPPRYCYDGADSPAGPLLVPLWDCCDSVTAVWQRPSGLEFIRFDIEEPGDHTVLCRSEQGLWASVFFDLIEHHDLYSPASLLEAAAAVQFLYLDHVLAPPESDDYYRYRANVIRTIDETALRREQT